MEMVRAEGLIHDYITRDEEGNVLQKKEAQSPAGHEVEIYVLKTKTCRWDRKLGYYSLNYTRGVDVLQDTIEMAIHFGLIDNSVQGTFKIMDPETGEVLLDENGEPLKIRGRKNLKPYFEENKKLWRKLYDLVYSKIREKEDPYIKSFEEMLSIDLDEKLGFDIHKEAED